MTKKAFAKLFKTKEEVECGKRYICELQAEAEADGGHKALYNLLWYGVHAYNKMTRKEMIDFLWDLCIEDKDEDFAVEEFVNNQVIAPKN